MSTTDLWSLLTICQQRNGPTEGISKNLESELLNLKLVGGNMYTEELQSKEKFINNSCSEEANYVNVEEKIMGTLLIESENDKKYGDLNRLLINSMIQEQKRYPNIKASTYIMLCKYILERINNKN